MTLTAAHVADVFDRRAAAGTALVEDAAAVAQACHAMARRFAAGGTLFVFGTGTCSTDAAHIAVEFVHPVIVGKRALPALSLTNDVAAFTGIAQAAGLDEVFAAQLGVHARRGDIALGLCAEANCASVRRALEVATEQGLLTVLMIGGTAADPARLPPADHVLRVYSDDPLIIKEVQVTTYHVLWELVHVFFEHPGLLAEAEAK
jgi:D-sedoheptulose 7-phosphate isomerase